MGQTKTNPGLLLLTGGLLLILAIAEVSGDYGDLAGKWKVDYGGLTELRLSEGESYQLPLRISNVQPVDAAADYSFWCTPRMRPKPGLC